MNRRRQLIGMMGAGEEASAAAIQIAEELSADVVVVYGDAGASTDS